MNKVGIIAAFAMSATSATAGALSDPIVEPAVIIENATSSAGHDWLVPVFFIVMLVAGLSQPVPINQ